jgi:hypothetical protein
MTRILKDDSKLRMLSDNVKNYKRDLEMAKLYVEWKTLTAIWNQYWITRERARQIVGRVSSQQNNLVLMFKAICN